MTTTTTTPAAALAGDPSDYTIRMEATVTCAYTLELSKSKAKAICADFLDPDEKWDDQAEHTLETAMEILLEDVLQGELGGCLPQVITTKIEGKQVKLTLATDAICVDLETPEVA